MDAPIEIDQGPARASGGRRTTTASSTGPRRCASASSIRATSMTVRLAQDIGMPLIAEYAKRFGVYDDLPPLPVDGARRRRDDACMRMVGGLFDVRQWRPQDHADADRPHPGPLRPHHLPARPARMRRLRRRQMGRPGRADAGRQARAGARSDDRLPDHLDDGGRGAARHRPRSVKEVGKPIAGKTGTTNDDKDVWFVGFSPDLAVGVYHRLRQAAPHRRRGATGGHSPRRSSATS